MDANRIAKLNHDYLKDEPLLDINKFNTNFDNYIVARNKKMQEELTAHLAELNKPVPKPELYELSVGQILINMVDTFFSIMDDAVRMRFDKEFLLRDHRMFYMGLWCVLIAGIGFIYYVFAVEMMRQPFGEVDRKIRVIDVKN
jgi:hypothetical protein